MLFFGGLGAEMLVDHLWRRMWAGGFPEPVWYAIQILLATVALVLAYRGTAALSSLGLRLTVVVGQAALGFGLYVWAVMAYIVGTGVDSL